MTPAAHLLAALDQPDAGEDHDGSHHDSADNAVDQHALLLDRRQPLRGSTLASTAMIQHEIDVPLHRTLNTLLAACGSGVSKAMPPASNSQQGRGVASSRDSRSRRMPCAAGMR